MAKSNKENVLTEEFLMELYNCAITDNHICAVVSQYMKDEFLPDSTFKLVNNSLKKFFIENKIAPKYGVFRQIVASSRAASELLDEIQELSTDVDPNSVCKQLERYLKLVQFKQMYKEVGKVFDDGDGLDAIQKFQVYATELANFSLAPDDAADMVESLEKRLMDNRERATGELNNKKTVNSFFIDCLDAVNEGRNLRTQLTMFAALPGVGKTHVIRWIGYNAAYVSGLNVLHVQLEGSKSEVMDAYQASLLKTTAYSFEQGRVSDHALEMFKKIMNDFSGHLMVYTKDKFGKRVSTSDIRHQCDKFRLKYGVYPDVLLVDSLDLCEDSTGKNYSPKEVRFKRLNVAWDFKDMATELDMWVVVSYQAQVSGELRKNFLNDEKEVLTGDNLSEAKGLERPVTHLITLNRTYKEQEEETLRLHRAKWRFGKNTKVTNRICTDFDNECFYDRSRTLNLPKDE